MMVDTVTHRTVAWPTPAQMFGRPEGIMAEVVK
jgi:hypothetical protein